MAFFTEAATVAAERGRPGVPGIPRNRPLPAAGRCCWASGREAGGLTLVHPAGGGSVGVPRHCRRSDARDCSHGLLSGITTHVPGMAKTRPKKEKKEKNRTFESYVVLELVCPLMSIVPILTDRKKLPFSSLKLQETCAGG